tara:strand:+ start:2914 stop:3657 length:744 start_codon:yes stop_codon:yes gene_type:complete
MNSIFISVRTNSSRLPNKAILDLCGKPSIQYLIENLKNSKFANKIILCTTERQDDDILCKIAKSSGIKIFRGSEKDKLLRWLGACEQYGVEFFVNVDGDDLFFDFELADLCLSQSAGVDFIDGRGLYNDVYGIRAECLRIVCETKNSKDTEFIRPHFVDPKKRFVIQEIKNVPPKYKKKNIRMTLDYLEDFVFFESVIEHFKLSKTKMTFDGILELLKNKPELIEINWFREKEWRDNQNKMINRVIL